MQFLQQLEGNRIVAKSIEKSYFNVRFAEPFGTFLEALRRENLITEHTSRIVVERGHMWADCRREDGIQLITQQNPLLYASPTRLYASATRSTLEIFEHVLSRYASYCISEDIAPEEVKINAQYHEKLNPMLWDQYDDGFHLNEQMRRAMLDISHAFLKYLKMPEMVIEDIILTGSNANYNWTNDSDIDLHIVIDMKQAEDEYGKIVPEYLESKRRLWGEQHEIKLHDADVEVYVQDQQEPHTSTGIYSLKDDTWITQPKHEQPTYDSIDVRTKAAKWANHIDDLADSEHCDPKRAEEMTNRLKRYRKAGLQESGEFSVENLVFKYLRNNGYLEKLSDCKRRGVDVRLSLEDEEWWKP